MCIATGSCTFINLLPSYDRIVASVQDAHTHTHRYRQGQRMREGGREEVKDRRRKTEMLVEGE